MKLIYSTIIAAFFLVSSFVLLYDVNAAVCLSETQVVFSNGVFNSPTVARVRGTQYIII